MKRIKICTFAILLILSMTVPAACSRKDSGTNQGTSPSGTQSTSGTNQGGSNESGAGNSGTDSATDNTRGNTGNSGSQESSSGSNSAGGNRNGADQESSTGVIGGMIDDVEEGVDDMFNGKDASTTAEENR